MKIINDIIEYFRRDDFKIYDKTLEKFEEKSSIETDARQLKEDLEHNKKLIDIILNDSK